MAKLMQKEFRRAIDGDGEIMDVLTESLGSKELARYCLCYLAQAAESRTAWWKIVRWFWFAFGVGVTIGIGLIVKVFS